MTVLVQDRQLEGTLPNPTGGESSSSQDPPPIAPWDDDFHRAMNVTKGKDKLKPPAGGRVTGMGKNNKLREFHKEPIEVKRSRKRAYDTYARDVQLGSQVSTLQTQVGELTEKCSKIDDVVATAVQSQMHEKFDDAVASAVNNMMPSICEAIAAWHAGGRVGPMPSFSVQSSNEKSTSRVSPASATMEVVTPPATKAAPDVPVSTVATAARAAVPGSALRKTVARAAVPGTKLAITTTPAAPKFDRQAIGGTPPSIDGPSPLEELDALASKVTN